MNKLNFRELRKHPIKTVSIVTSLTTLVAFVALKIIHNVPLMNLEEKYLEDFGANGYSLGPIATEFFRIDPRVVDLIKASDDTIIIQDTRSHVTFTITCQGSDKYCLLRNDPYRIPLTGTTFGSGESISRKSVGEFLNKAMNPNTQHIV